MLGSETVPSPTTRSLLTSEDPSGFYFSLDVASALLITFATEMRSVVRILVGSSAGERAQGVRVQGAGWGRHCQEIQCFSGNHSRKFEVSELFFFLQKP